MCVLCELKVATCQSSVVITNDKDTAVDTTNFVINFTLLILRWLSLRLQAYNADGSRVLQKWQLKGYGQSYYYYHAQKCDICTYTRMTVNI